jgi:transposase-like protein
MRATRQEDQRAPSEAMPNPPIRRRHHPRAVRPRAGATRRPLPGRRQRLDEAGPDLLSFTAFDASIWRQVWSNNPIERLNPPRGEYHEPTLEIRRLVSDIVPVARAHYADWASRAAASTLPDAPTA